MLQMRGQSGLLSLASACGAVASQHPPIQWQVPTLPATPHSYGHLYSLRQPEPLATRFASPGMSVPVLGACLLLPAAAAALACCASRALSY